MKHPTTYDDILQIEDIKMQCALRKEQEVKTLIMHKTGKVEWPEDEEWTPESSPYAPPKNW